MSHASCFLKPLVRSLASLRLTVALLAMSMVLIFCGTLAQRNMGIWQAVETYFRSWVAWIDLQIFVQMINPHRAGADWHLPFPGGALLMALLIVNLLAAHAARFKLTWKRAGINILHTGLILLLASDFVTGLLAEEGVMSIDEGGSSNYVEDQRETELAIVDSSDPQHDRVVAIPQSLLERGGVIRAASLPFEIEVKQWMANSRVVESTGATPATHGIGLEAQAIAQPPVPGIDPRQIDAPSAYITLRREGKDLGTWLVSLNLSAMQTVTIDDGSSRQMQLRFARTYKPYTLHLIDFRHDRFVGTGIARNFSSRVRVVDPSHDTDRETLIYMNNPLRHGGDAFYQASFKPDETGTVLQVVRNPGWLLPYVACVMVGGGLLAHFMIGLINFLRSNTRRQSAKLAPARSAGAWVWLVGAAAVLIAVGPGLRMPAKGAYDTASFAHLPVSADGRVKPIDTVARNALLAASGRQTVKVGDRTLSATEFLLDLIARPETATDYPVMRIDHPDVLALIDQPPEGKKRFSLNELEPHWGKVAQQKIRAEQVPDREQDPFQRSVLSLYRKTTNLLELQQLHAPYAIPPLASGEEWRPFRVAAHEVEGRFDAHSDLPVSRYVAMLSAYHEKKPADFNRVVGAYAQSVRQSLPGDWRRSTVEIWFNRIMPFYGATIVFVIAFIGAMAALLLRSWEKHTHAERVRRGVVALMWGGWIVYTLAIGVRIYLQGRPPVTNLYSSAIFIGWVGVLAGLLIERLVPMIVAALSAAAIAVGSLIIAHNLGQDGDTMQMMQAVLDSNFWLATHVITITIGYAATFFAGLLGVIYILRAVFTAQSTDDSGKTLARMIYGVTCFALFFSFVGTVLGGIWADQSWGRFWGWDPKENGAALIVLINAILLHARWGGLVRERGIAILAVAGNVVTAWSWFGTNLLGVGLHAYGFMQSGVFWLGLFVSSQLLLIFIAMLPLRAWDRARE